MTIFTNNKGSKFIIAKNDRTYGKTMKEDLQEQGFCFYMQKENSSSWHYQDVKNLLAAINFLKGEEQLQLFNILQGLENLPQVNKIADVKFSVDYLNSRTVDAIGRIEISNIFEFLNNHLAAKNWHMWQLQNYVNDQTAAKVDYAWIFNQDKLPIDPNETFNDDAEYDYNGRTWTEILRNTLYSSYVRLMYCNNHGKSNIDQIDNSWVLAGSHLATADLANKCSDEQLAAYMQVKYHMHPAKPTVTYKA